MVSWVLYCLARQKQRHDSQRAASEAVAHEEDLLYSSQPGPAFV